MTGANALRSAVLVVVTVLFSLCTTSVHAHTPLKSVLTLEERAPGEFVARWERTQGLEDVSAAYDLLKPVFPEHCRFAPPRLACGESGLSGRIGFDGLADLSSAGVIKIRWLNGNTEVLSLTATEPHLRLSEARHVPGTFRSGLRFLWLGVVHIWFGLDHLLFVLGLCWLVDSWRVLVKTVTAFTIAHSLTLGAVAFGFDGVPVAPVEAVIALSIAFVAVELAREARTKQPSFTHRRPWIVAFAFGLLHGFGFASAFAELELAATERPIALLGFNVGVELGQVAFIAVLLSLGPVVRRLERALRVRFATAGYYALGVAAMVWFFERVLALAAAS